ncbi:hypothetical protein [Pseudomonas sp. zfem003]|uniref:hypothetical protein n=1 Tax=Pseudomonas sp. zfem003 TaxID=3078198 RepID=UPI00292813C2|nr:hypothetical protein [Pseudomonas sp. zfem003]MDU9396001.1 hypothetical protein [Pseudomonas sp. zfem003]
MAHHLFEFANRTLRLHDVDVVLVRHLLEQGAAAIGQHALAESLRQWEWLGPGVWVGVDESVLVLHPAVFPAAAQILAGFGPVIPLAYVREAMPELGPTSDLATPPILSALRTLEGLFQ